MTDSTDSSNNPTQAQLRGEIDQTRQELGDTVDHLADKLDVKAQTKRRVESVKSTIGDKAARVKEAAPPAVQNALDQAGTAAAPTVQKAKHHNKQLIVGAAALLLALVVLRRWRSS